MTGKEHFSVSAIKIGRYTIEHKTSNIKEAKVIESQKKMMEKNSTNSFSSLPILDAIMATEMKEYSSFNSTACHSTSGKVVLTDLL